MPFDIDPQYVETPAEVKPDVFSLDGLIAWLEKQPADGTYNYGCTGGCLIFRYLADSGIPVSSIGGNGWHDKNLKYHVFPGHVAGHHLVQMGEGYGSPFNIVAISAIGPNGYTFGAALARAKALRERQP